MIAAAPTSDDLIRADLAARAAKRVTDAADRAGRKAAREDAAMGRDLEKAQREAEKNRIKLAKAEGVSRCAALSKRVPPEFQEWGSVRTHAWIDALKIVSRIAKSKRGSLVQIETAISDLERAATVDLSLIVQAETERRAVKASKRNAGAMGRMARGMRP